MMNIWIRWQCGYWAYVDGNRLKLRGGSIYFYNEKGKVVECSLTDSVQFDMRVNCGFRFTKSCYKLNFTKGDVFAVRHKGSEYDLYIPMSEVDFTMLEKKEKVFNEGMDIIVKRRCAFNAYNFNFWNPICDCHNFYRLRGNERLNFEIHIEITRTDKGKMIDEIVESIYKDCGVTISVYDMSKIMKKYRIEKI